MSNCIKNISIGNGYALANGVNGSVTGWGWNNYAQATGGNNLNNIQKVDAGTFTSIALKNDGTIKLWGYTGFFNIPKAHTLTNIVDVSIHNDYALTLNGNGVVNVIEDTFYSTPLSQHVGPSGKTNVTGIAAGFWQSHIIFTNGNLSGYGEPVNAQLPKSLAGIGAKKIKCGGLSSFAVLLSNGRISGWGFGTAGTEVYLSNNGIVYKDFAINGFGIIGIRDGSTTILDYIGDSTKIPTDLNNLDHSAISMVEGSKDGADNFGFVRTDGFVFFLTGTNPSLMQSTNYTTPPIPNICNAIITLSSSSSSSSRASSSSSSLNIPLPCAQLYTNLKPLESINFSSGLNCSNVSQPSISGFSLNKTTLSNGVITFKTLSSGRVYYSISTDTQLGYDIFYIKRQHLEDNTSESTAGRFPTIKELSGPRTATGNFYANSGDILKFEYRKDSSTNYGGDVATINYVYLDKYNQTPDPPLKSVYLRFLYSANSSSSSSCYSSIAYIPSDAPCGFYKICNSPDFYKPCECPPVTFPTCTSNQTLVTFNNANGCLEGYCQNNLAPIANLPVYITETPEFGPIFFNDTSYSTGVCVN